MNYEFIFVFLVAYLPILFAVFYCLAIVKKNEGYILALHKAPVLREYVKEYVPIDDSKEAKEVMQKRMKDTEEKFNEAFNLSGEVLKGKEEDLV